VPPVTRARSAVSRVGSSSLGAMGLAGMASSW
jgi:hypothetical protein